MKRDYYYIAAITVLLLLIIFLKDALSDEKIISNGRESAIEEKNAQITTWQNKYGETLQKKQAAELRLKDVEKAYPEIVKVIEDRMEIKFKNLRAYIQNEFEVRGSGTGTATNHYYIDSAGNKTIDSAVIKTGDKFLQHEVTYYPNKLFAPFHYVYRDTARTAIASDKVWWKVWKDERLYSTTLFGNPDAKITGTTNILVKNYRDKRWVVSVGGYYDPLRQQYGFSINGGYALFKF